MNTEEAHDVHKEVERLTEHARKLGLKVLWRAYTNGAAVQTEDGYEHRKLATLKELSTFLDGVEFQRDLHQARVDKAVPKSEWEE